MRTRPSREVCGLLQHLFLIRYRYHWSSASIAWIKCSLWNWSHQVQVLTLSSYQPGCEFRQGTLWSVISCMLQTRHQGTEMLRCMGQDFHVNLSEEPASTPCDHWGGDMFRDPAILSKVDVGLCVDSAAILFASWRHLPEDHPLWISFYKPLFNSETIKQI